MVQTGIGPRPCPSCGGKGLTNEISANESKSSFRKMSILEILLYSAIAGLIGYFIWAPIGLFGPFIVFIYLEENYR
jgi:hypothetical protein